MARNPRILIVTPEITYLPPGMGNMANLSAKAGGLADVSASLVQCLFNRGADVHVALPHFRRIFRIESAQLQDTELRMYKKLIPDSRIHLAQDRAFFYSDRIYGSYHAGGTSTALAFQREVINNIVPRVQPDLIHCNDWMTGLVPAMARRMGIGCLFTLHNIHTQRLTLAQIEDKGIDAAEFWDYLFYSWPPHNYEESRTGNPVDLLASGIFAAHFINTVSPTFLDEIAEGRHGFIPENVRYEVAQKKAAGCACGILNAPDPAFNPGSDPLIAVRYEADTHAQAKRQNKTALQQRLGLLPDASAPLFFWPSRLDPTQKGCTLLTDILYEVVSTYWAANLQLAVVANGAHQRYFREIARFHDFLDRVAVHDFDEPLSHQGYAAADFVLMPSLFEPCGLPQMIGCLYGTLPVAHDTGGLHDTVRHLDLAANTGNGFVFRDYDTGGLRWAIDEAMAFHGLPAETRAAQVARVMKESAATFTHDRTAKEYVTLYERMLERPLINPY